MEDKDKNDLIIAALRHREGVPESGLCRLLGSRMELGVLINRSWKVDHGVEINDLEFRVTEESGELVNKLAKKMYKNRGLFDNETVPFPQCDVDISTLIRIVNAGAKSLNRPIYTDYTRRLIKELNIGKEK